MPGLDRTVLDTIDPELAVRRILRDSQSDFILAPHYDAIFAGARDELWSVAHDQLRSGTYQPELPLTMSVPKPHGFTRPGSILYPVDRIVYQGLADLIAPLLEERLDRARTFSQIPAPPDEPAEMFLPNRLCFAQLQAALGRMARAGGCFIRADVANYFERIPQHHLVNLLQASGCQTEIVRLLEQMLRAFQQRNSVGIVQGVFPSDLLGNYYLSDLDAYCELHNIPSARYVDDLYLHFETEADAVRGLMNLIEQLRRDGLNLNESKSGLRSAMQLLQEETQIDRMFRQAYEEVEAEEELEIGYGFSIDWESEEENEDETEERREIASVIRLYESIDEHPRQADRIERFCLPILRAAREDVAVERSMQGVVERPYLARVYLSYLSRFVAQSSAVNDALQELLGNQEALVSDYQIMFLIAGLMDSTSIKRQTVNTSIRLLGSTLGQSVRALTAIFAAKHGTPQQRRAVRSAYENEASPYVRAAILYASRYFTGVERKTCISAWGGHSALNSLIATALRAR